MDPLVIILGLAALYLFSQPGGFSLSHPVQTPGINIPISQGFGITLPGGNTYYAGDGHQITVMAGAPTAPGGFVLGTRDDGMQVWFNTASGAYTGTSTPIF